jgi:enamine deaminase RidA (YjgF/YER057c/UK114 family)
MEPAIERRYRTGNPYEATAGYSRAIRVRDMIAVSGTTATEADGSVTGRGDAARQASRIFELIEDALIALGGVLDDIIRIRIYLRDMADFPAIAAVHRERLGQVAPAATGIEVSRFVSDDILIEIEADAIVRERTASP